jgi:ankyrin repeat protein
MKVGVLIRHLYSAARRFANIGLIAMACVSTSTLAHAQTSDLVTAAQRGDLPAVTTLIQSGVDVNARRIGDHWTALMAASRQGNLEVVQALLAAKADVNAGAGPGEDGITALFLASDRGGLAVVQALLAAKADPSTKVAKMGATPLIQAVQSNDWDVARALLKAGANVNATATTGVSALVLAARGNSPKSLAMVQALLAAHADVNGNFFGGDTALGVASSTGSVEIVQALLAANPWVNVNVTQRDGKTPLMNASAKGRADVVRLLLAAKADLSAQDRDGRTALTLALQNDHAEVAKLLTSAGASVPAQK